MSKNNNALKSVSWCEVFTFPKVFKSAHIARQPGMLILGLVLIIMLYLGGWALDRVWSICGEAAMTDEVMLRVKDKAQFDKTYADRDALRMDLAAKLYVDAAANADSMTDFMPYISQNIYLRDAFTKKLYEQPANNPSGVSFSSYADVINKAAADKKSWGDILKDAKKAHEREMDKIDAIMSGIEKRAEKAVEAAGLPKNQMKDEKEKLQTALAEAQYGVTLVQRDFAQRVQQVEGFGIFEGFVAFERDSLYNAMACVGDLNFFGGLAQYQDYLSRASKDSLDVQAKSGLDTRVSDKDRPGVVFYVLLMGEGVLWMITNHPVYAAVFILWCAILWSVFGGAIYRMAAVRFARGEKLSMSTAVKYSIRRFLNFFGAPLIPLGFVMIMGAFIFVLSLLGNIPFAGPLLVAILCGLFILLGIAMSLILVGMAGMVWLQYPTIASDGTDALGAVSDSYDHFFNKPFRTMLLGAVAFVYGVITYLILRLFVFAGLLMVHKFVQMAIFTGGESLGSGASRLDVLWAEPTFWNLYSTNYIAAGWWESVCAAIIGVWVNLVLGVLAAYLVTYLASSSTVIHFILRNECESTDYDCIYMENEDDMPLDVKPAEKPQEQTPAQETPAETPAETTEEAPEAPMPDGC